MTKKKHKYKISYGKKLKSRHFYFEYLSKSLKKVVLSFTLFYLKNFFFFVNFLYQLKKYLKKFLI